MVAEDVERFAVEDAVVVEDCCSAQIGRLDDGVVEDHYRSARSLCVDANYRS